VGSGTKQRDTETIETKFTQTILGRTMLEQTATGEQLEGEALNALVDGGKKNAKLTKTLQRAPALPLLVWGTQVRQATQVEKHRQLRLTQVEQEQRPVGERIEEAEIKTRHALYTSDYSPCQEAEIEETQRRLLPHMYEKRELESAETRSSSRFRYLEEPGSGAEV
jgi:hypothetical protein